MTNHSCSSSINSGMNTTLSGPTMHLFPWREAPQTQTGMKKLFGSREANWEINLPLLQPTSTGPFFYLHVVSSAHFPRISAGLYTNISSNSYFSSRFFTFSLSHIFSCFIDYMVKNLLATSNPRNKSIVSVPPLHHASPVHCFVLPLPLDSTLPP